MIKAVAIKTGSNGKQYLDLRLGDRTGELTGKKWDVSEGEYPALHELKEKDIVRIKGVITEWAGQLQFHVQRIRRAVAQDGQVIEDFVKAAPEKPEDMYAYIWKATEGFRDEELQALCQRILEENRKRLLYYPAASKNHHAQLGGLLYHTKRMLMTGERVCEVYTDLNRDLVLTGVILHDMEKLDEIEAGEDGIASGYSFEGQLLGHIVQGVKMVDRVTLEMGMDREKAIMVEHMILSHHYEPEYGSPRRPLFPEAEVLHYLDILDARMYDMQQALEATDPGGFSDRVWTLDNRRLYRPKEEGEA